MRYRLLCLDAGFTLLSPRRNLADTLLGALADHGRVPDDEELHRAWEAADRWFWDEYDRPDNNTWGDDERINATWRAFHGVMLGELGVSEAVMPQIVERILASQLSPESWELFGDVEETFEALEPARRAGLQIGVVSDWNSNLPEIFAALALDRQLDFILASGAVGVAKPSPEFYRVALDRAGVEPHEAIMVGDSYRADVEGSLATGMDAVLLDRRGKAGPAEAPVIRSLLELPPIILGERPGQPDASSPVPVDA